MRTHDVNKINNSRKGFTLVELLIVIVVIGVLASRMMLSSRETMNTAKASKIVSDLVTLRTAILAWYTDNYDCVEIDGRVAYKGHSVQPIQEYDANTLGIDKYIGHGTINLAGAKWKGMTEGAYAIYDAGQNNRTTWFVGYRFAKNESAVKEKLKLRAKSLGLKFSDNYPNGDKDYKDGTKDSCVWLKVFGEYKINN